MKTKKIMAAAVASAMIIGGSLVLGGCDRESENEEETVEATEATEIETEKETEETETETEQTSVEESETVPTTSEETEESVQTTETTADPYKLYTFDELEVESFTDSKQVLPFHAMEDYSLALKTDWGQFLISNGEAKVGKIDIALGDMVFELDCEMDEVGSTARAYLVKNNDSIYIYTESSLMDDYEALNVYEFGNGSISFVGSMEGMDVGAYLGEPFTDPGSFELVDAAGMGSPMFLAGRFKVGDDGMPVATSNIWQFRDYNPDIRYFFENDMTGYAVDKNGNATTEEKTVTPEDMFLLVETDQETYIDIQTDAGDIIRIDITEAVKYERDELGEYFNFFRAIFRLGILDNLTTYNPG